MKRAVVTQVEASSFGGFATPRGSSWGSKALVFSPGQVTSSDGSNIFKGGSCWSRVLAGGQQAARPQWQCSGVHTTASTMLDRVCP